jgi:tetratricopeptide (TPR) repeat protein
MMSPGRERGLGPFHGGGRTGNPGEATPPLGRPALAWWHRRFGWIIPVVLAGCSSAPPPPAPPPVVVRAQHDTRTAFALSNAGNWTAAAGAWQRLAEHYAALNDLPNEAVAWHNLGQAVRELGDLDRAGVLFERAAAINQEIGRTNEWWRNQIALLQVEAQSGQTNALDQRFARLTPLLPALAAPELRGLFLNERGLWQQQQGDLIQAGDSFRQALDFFTRDKSPASQAAATANLARLHTAQSDYSTALTEWKKALALYEALADAPGIACALAGQGRTLLTARQDLPRAAEVLRRAALNYRFLKNTSNQIATLRTLAECLQAQQKDDEAARIEAEIRQLTTGR